MAKKTESNRSKTDFRPPIVAVVGHVDHGKTTLLDAIRKTNVAAREHGGITQHIGAYQVTVPAKAKDGEGRYITLIDTPGHEAFTKMRSRGASVADIAVLVVAADDSVKPQTEESVKIIKESGVKMLVAVNKMDLPAANLDKVKKDLARIGVQLEGFGGDVPYSTISAKTGQGVRELLELILLVYDLDPKIMKLEAPPAATVVETRLDRGKGMVATVIVTAGKLGRNLPLYDGINQIGKIRALFNENGIQVIQAIPGQPAEILGLTAFPAVGATITTIPIQPEANTPVEPKTTGPSDDGMPDFLKPLDEIVQQLPVILKADTAGSLEAITLATPQGIRIVQSGIGPVSEADVLLAKSTKSFIVGFNVKLTPVVTKLAQTEKVVIRVYPLIYELLAELNEVADGARELLSGETEIGAGVVIAEFPFDGQRVAGTKVIGGRLARGDRVKFVREDQEYARGKIKSIRQGKTEINKIEANQQCGILFDKPIDFKIGDSIIALS
jgi:translation initiation factor IF-2